MCGIVGVLASRSSDESLAIVARMTETIVHRGPDDVGTYSIDGVAIGMRRLSIIDLATGHQPMRSDDGVAIVFNGEVYNYRELRAQLQRSGLAFQTESDTEVVLNLYRLGGLKALEALEGMFAVCLVDERTRQVHLLRDRIGIKPLYFGEIDGKFYFASELKAIVAGLRSKPTVDEQSIYDYLTLRYVPSPRTIWRGLSKLGPGQRLTYRLSDRAWSIESYWKPRFKAEAADPSRDYDAEFERNFLRAVQSHVVAADVPVGALLSGGLDSSTVVAAAVETGARHMRTFSVGFEDGERFNELSYASQVAQHLGTEHREIVIGRHEFLDFFPEFVWYSDEPLADLACIPLYYVSRLASSDVKVVISGEGADEVFAGYNLDQLARIADARGQYLSWVPRFAFAMAGQLMNGHRGHALRTMGSFGWSGFLKARGTNPTANWTDAEKRGLWRGSAIRPTEDLVRSWYDDCDSLAPLDLLQHVWCKDWLVEDLLMKADKMTMANSIELRVPYLTHPLVEWAQSLPLESRVGNEHVGYVSKRILRRFAKGRLPEFVINRPKQGFPVPAYEWLQRDVGGWAASRLSEFAPSLANWIDMQGAKRTLERARLGDLVAAHQVWGLLVLGQWLKRWI
jgi:asparagine synthase (glutamine-hydrolysing)